MKNKSVLIEAYEPAVGSDKLMRFGTQTVKFESGNVFLPRKAPWLDVYVQEITGFPGTKYNDQVDSTSQALDYLGQKAYSGSVWSRFAGHAV